MGNGKYIYIQEEDFKCPTFDAFDNFLMAHPSPFDDLHNPNFFSPINLSSEHQNDSMPPNLLITPQNNTDQSHLHHHHHNNTNLSFGLMNDECAAVNVVASSGTSSTASIFDDHYSLMPPPPPLPPPPPPFDQPPPRPRARGRGRPPKVLPPGLPRPPRRSAARPPPPPQLIPCERSWIYTPHQGFPDGERKKYFRRDGMTHISDDQIKSKGKKQLILGPQQQEPNLQLQPANLSSPLPPSSSEVVLMGRGWGVMDAEGLTISSVEEPGGPNLPILIDIDPEGLQSWKLRSN